jgi:hypothetical protein
MEPHFLIPSPPKGGEARERAAIEARVLGKERQGEVEIQSRIHTLPRQGFLFMGRVLGAPIELSALSAYNSAAVLILMVFWEWAARPLLRFWGFSFGP